jgi:tetratricopeptide (TPR) repeat protein
MQISRRVLGPEHSYTVQSMCGLANTYTWLGKYAEAETLLKQALEIRRRLLGPDHSFTLSTLSDLGDIHQRQGNYALARSYASEALVGRRRTLGAQHPDTMNSAAALALAYESQGKFAESEPLAQEAAETDRTKRPESWQRFREESLLGASLAGQRKFAEAEPLLLAGYQGMDARKERMQVPNRYYLDLAHESIIHLYQAWGKRQKVAEWSKK